MRGNLIKVAAFALLIIGATDAKAQQSVAPWVVNGGGGASPLTRCQVGTVASGTCGMPVTITGGTGGTVTANQGTPAAGGAANAWPVLTTPSAASTSGVAPVQSSAVETGHVIKASAGNLYDFNVSADTTLSAAAWIVMIFNSTTVPAAGAVAPVKCYLMPSGATSISAAFPIPMYLSTGISIAVSTGSNCFVKADSAHGFISADAQ